MDRFPDFTQAGSPGGADVELELKAEPEFGGRPEVRARRNAVSAVIPRRPRTTSLRRVAVIPSALANWLGVSDELPR